MSKGEERVAAGAAWLDEVAPGWERKIDLATLNISEPCHCVCGQVQPLGLVENALWGPNGYSAVCEWARERARLGSHAWMVEHGFYDEWDSEAWVALIKDRFDSGVLSDVEEET